MYVLIPRIRIWHVIVNQVIKKRLSCSAVIHRVPRDDEGFSIDWPFKGIPDYESTHHFLPAIRGADERRAIPLIKCNRLAVTFTRGRTQAFVEATSQLNRTSGTNS